MNTTTDTTTFSSGYLLSSTRDLSDWMVALLADDLALSIRGTHGFSRRHPRAPWLTLVVSSVMECSCCQAPVRWEEGAEAAYCGRCAEAEIALAGARGAVPTEVRLYETEPTDVEAYVPIYPARRLGAVA